MSLRQAINVTVWTKSDWRTLFDSTVQMHVRIGRDHYILRGRMTNDQIARSDYMQMSYPVRVMAVGVRTYWRYKNCFYWDDQSLSWQDVHALLRMKEQRQERQLNNAHAHLTAPDRMVKRIPITSETKQAVYQRDRGRCRECGSPNNLQYDHIIPVKLGGGNSIDNLQLLCGTCNRRKSANL